MNAAGENGVEDERRITVRKRKIYEVNQKL
jgi:hypothetical protein